MGVLADSRGRAALWIGVAVVGGRDGIRTALSQPIWAVVLLATIFLAGLNLVAFRQTHEVVCRMEAERHRWLSLMVGAATPRGRSR